ncbi:MAG TPA: metal-dependent phosphohydrolase [Clostridiales bacterium]|nr:metal-dependent phosphohydrolase [Clostridiales bacterium]
MTGHPRFGRRLADLEAGERVDIKVVVARKSLQPFRDPGKGSYLSLWLTDASGGMAARLWDGAREAASRLQVDRPVRLLGTVDSFRDSLQLNVERVEPLADADVRPEDFLPVGPRDPLEVEAELEERLGRVSDAWLASLLAGIFGDGNLRRSFLRAPAGKSIHHAYLGGLADHTLEVVSLALAAGDYYSPVDSDLLCCGALLHDIGKLEEYRWDWTIDYTDRGRLIGHPVLGYQLVARRIAGIDAFPRELEWRLLHLILSHHGELAWGAPVLPQTLEAAVLAHADLLSGRAQQFEQLLRSPRPAGQVWTAYDRVLGRYLYAGEPDEPLKEVTGP